MGGYNYACIAYLHINLNCVFVCFGLGLTVQPLKIISHILNQAKLGLSHMPQAADKGTVNYPNHTVPGVELHKLTDNCSP